MIKIGLVMPTFIYNEERYRWCERSLTSLVRTEYPGYRPHLVMVIKGGIQHPPQFSTVQAFGIFDPSVLVQPEDARNGCGALIYGFDWLFQNDLEITHALFVGDDFVYHPSWLKQQEYLIARHPEAASTYVYRSNNTRHHRTIREEAGDCLVTNISGPGCFSREEWKAFGMTYRDFPRPDGCTLDILHARMRPGERWVTKSSYIQQIGVRGMHNNSGECDEALDFVGEGATLHLEDI